MIKNAKIKFVLSNTYLSGFYEIIDEIIQLQKKDKDAQIVLIVPDKFSLNAEQIFMERTVLSSIFNVWLTTLSRFVSKVIESDESQLQILSKNSGTMLVSKILTENRDKIGTYKKVSNNYSLAETMFNCINLLKSSGVKPEELLANYNNTNFGLKIKDIHLIYSEYEKEMTKHIDAITRLEIFNKKIKNNESIKDAHIFVSMFESWTNEQIKSLTILAKNCATFTISQCANTLQDNSYIYDNSVFGNLKGSFDDNHICYDIKNVELKESLMQKFLAKNLFALKDSNRFETDSIKIVECSNIDEEVRYVASKIKYLILSKRYVFDDINVAVNGLDTYFLTIKKIFEEFDFPYYIDNSRTLLEHYFLRLVLNILSFVCNEKTISKAISIIDSPIFVLEKAKKSDFQIYIQKYNIFGEELFNKFDLEQTELCQNAEFVRANIFDGLKIFEQSFKSSTTISQKVNALIEYFDSINAKSIIKEFALNEDDIIEKQVDLQVYQKFEDTLFEAQSLVGYLEITNQNFFDMLKSALNSVNLMATPSRCDAIFVGDASKSTYYPRKVLFVLGSTQSRMPSYSSDDGTITDDEIAIFKASNRISPTIKEINKREKFKLFNLLTLPSEKLELCYSTLISNQIEFKSEFVIALQNVISQNKLPFDIEKFNSMEFKNNFSSQFKNPAYQIGTIKNAVMLFKDQSSTFQNCISKNLGTYLKQEQSKFEDSCQRFEISNAREKLFFKDKTSSSQVEKYFKCPFMQFVDYGIRIKETPKFEIKKVDIGNILHLVAEKFIERYIQNRGFFDRDIDAVIGNIFDFAVRESGLKNNSKNSYALKNLKEEANRFCRAILHQIEVSDFKPRWVEKKFENFSISNGLKLFGKIDRIDCLNNIENKSQNYDTDKNQNDRCMRIIDYKTGKDKFSFKDIYYGLKIQLFLYTKAISQKEDLQPVMVSYMPIKNKFVDFDENEFSNYKLDGVILKSNGTIFKVDKTLKEKKSSDVIDIVLKDDGSVYSKCQKYLIEKTDFDMLMNYSLDILTKATNEMIDGYISPKPFKEADNFSCKYCKYKSLCHYRIKDKGFREIKSKMLDDFKK